MEANHATCSVINPLKRPYPVSNGKAKWIYKTTFCCHVTLYIEVGKEGFDINTPPPPKKNDGIYNETIKDRISQNSYLLTIYSESYFYPKSVK